MLLDVLEAAFKAILYTAGGALLALGLLFFAAHVYDTWDAPEYPYSGFCPDFPTWEPSWQNPDDDL